MKRASGILLPVFSIPSKYGINHLSTLGRNWKWRLEKESMTPELLEKIRELTRISYRGKR